MPHALPCHVSRRHQQGLGLLEVTLLLVLVATSLVIAVVWLRAETPRLEADAQVEALRWADQALVAFAAAHGRLPCPANAPGGEEDCTLVGKGFLPSATLRLAAVGFAPGAERLRYVPGAGDSITLADSPMSDLYNPIGVDGEAIVHGVINELDFCSALALAADAGASTARAHLSHDGVVIPVAYAIAAPGKLDADGDGDSFDGVNVGASAEIAHPARVVGLDYDDRTLARDFGTLREGLGCSPVQTSLNGLALAVGATDEVRDMKESLVEAAAIMTADSAVKIALTAYNMSEAIGALTSAITKLGVASGLLSGAIASCVVLVGCALIPPYTAAVVASKVAIVAASASIAANVVSGVLTAVSFGLTLSVALEAGLSGDAAGPTPDYNAMANEICAAVPPAQSRLDAAVAAHAEATTAASDAVAAETAAWNALVAHADAVYAAEAAEYEADQALDPVGPAPPPTDRQPLLVALRSAGERRQLAETQLDEARGARDAAAGQVTDLTGALADIRAQLAAATDATEIARLQAAETNVERDLAAAETEYARQVAAVSDGEAELTAAEAALATARSNLVNSFPPGARRFDADRLVDAYLPAQQARIRRQADLELAVAELDDARVALDAANARCAEARALTTGGAPEPGAQFGIWNGAGAVLEGADRRGSVQ